jgi:N-acetylmuramoyl-L-alanine amidase
MLRLTTPSNLIARGAPCVMGCCVLLLAAAASAGTSAGRQEARLSRITLQDQAQSAVLTLSLSKPLAPHVFRLHGPERLVIDLPDTLRLGPLPTVPGGLVSALRSGRPAPRKLRLVLELSSALALQVEQRTQAGDWQLRIAPQMAAAPVRSAARVGAPSSAPQPTPMQSVRAAHAPSDAERPVIIAVDAGHGGTDPGATGQSGTHEKDVTLAIARALAARIDQEPGMRAVLTREGDYFVALRARIERARAAHADLFVSIHADAIRDREISGASVYILSERGASSEAARSLADEENAADLKGGISLAEQSPDLRSVLLNLSQNASIGASSEAADRVLSALDSVGEVRKHEVQQAAFVVLKSPDIPSMLVETAYISNPTEERGLRTAAQQQRVADAVFRGIRSFFRQYPPEGSRYARARDQGDAATSQVAGSGL